VSSSSPWPRRITSTPCPCRQKVKRDTFHARLSRPQGMLTWNALLLIGATTTSLFSHFLLPFRCLAATSSSSSRPPHIEAGLFRSQGRRRRQVRPRWTDAKSDSCFAPSIRRLVTQRSEEGEKSASSAPKLPPSSSVRLNDTAFPSPPRAEGREKKTRASLPELACGVWFPLLSNLQPPVRPPVVEVERVSSSPRLPVVGR